jgi:heat shock protein HslJ
MKITIVCAAVLTLAVCGCSAQAARDPAAAQATSTATSTATPARVNVADLGGTAWRFVEVAGAPVPAAVTATMRFRAGHASGRAGCNAYDAAYRIAANGVAHFQPGISTKMACLTPTGAMRVEHGVFAALREATTVAIENGQLLMRDAAGKPLARLVRGGSD